MLKKLLIAFIFIISYIIVMPAYALQTSAVQPRQPTINRDTLSAILDQKDYYIRQSKLIKFLKNYLQASLPDHLNAVRDTFNRVFENSDMQNKLAYADFMQGFIYNKQHNLRQAEFYMGRAIQKARVNNEPYLLFQFYSHLGFIQTDKGDFIGAIYSYRLATKEVVKLRDKVKDNRPQVSLNINISDLYYKSGFYAESLNYLDKALALLINDPVNKPQLISVVYYNKSENFYRMNDLDSLRAYHKKLNDPSNENYKIYTYRQRTGYYITLLKHNYPLAIRQIKQLQANKAYVASQLEDQRLADAYFMNGQLDSAKTVINKLLVESAENNHPEITYHLYETLAWIAEKEGDFKSASKNFQLSLKESQENNARLTQVGNISSQIKIDEAETSYSQKTEVYERERLWLIFTVVVAALIIVAIMLIYRNVTQKSHYEKLLFKTKKAELAFINSHEVRKHLTNILGIMDIIRHSENNKEDYMQCEQYLLKSADQLDEAIKNISEKLNE